METTNATTDVSSRRTFLRWATAVGGVLAGLLAGVPSLLAFLSPAIRRRHEEQWIRLGDAAQFELEVPVKVDFVDNASDAWVETRRLRNVWVYTDDGERFTVYNGRCTHLGCNYSLAEQEQVFRCPCHAGYFEVKTGAVLGGPPPRALDTLRTRVEDGVLYVAYQDFRLGVPQKIEA